MLYIFDKDGTLVSTPTPGRPANHPDEQVLLPGVAEKCRALQADGHELAIATNQGGVAFGFMTFEQARAVVEHAGQLIGARWVHFCPYHPYGKIKRFRRDAACRKPQPGMIHDLLKWSGYSPAETVYVGDNEVDRQAAEASKVGFIWAAEFFGWS